MKKKASSKTKKSRAKKPFNLKARISSALRLVWMKHPERTLALKQASVGKDKYRCADCDKAFTRKHVHVDHIEPVGKFEDWNTFILRLFCPVGNLQILCLDCHHRKTYS